MINNDTTYGKDFYAQEQFCAIADTSKKSVAPTLSNCPYPCLTYHYLNHSGRCAVAAWASMTASYGEEQKMEFNPDSHLGLLFVITWRTNRSLSLEVQLKAK